MDIKDLTIEKLRNGLSAREYSASEVVTAYFKEVGERNPVVNAYLETFEEKAFMAAETTDKRIASGEPIRPMEGVPFALKDNILIEGEIASSASKILSGYRAAYDATVTKKLSAAGAVILGRANMDEFAMGSSTENSAFGVVKNPWNYECVAGGSSGGSAAAVGGNMALAALGSDTGGSIRLPAAFCGVVGMKPTYGQVSRFGLQAMASSLDQIGPFAKTVGDAEEIFSVIRGRDRYDATTVDNDLAPIDLSDPSKITIGIPREYFVGGLDKETESAIEEVKRAFQKAGFRFKEISLPNSKYALSVYYIIMFAEVATNLERYDGMRYGRNVSVASLIDLYMKTRGDGFGEETKRRALMGSFVLSAGYYDAYYAKAQKVRSLIRRDFTEAFKEVDLIFAPTSPTTAFKIGEKTDDPIKMYLSDIFTMTANLSGVPAISIPVKGRMDKMPVGFQLIAPHFRDRDLFAAGKLYENF